MKWYCFVIIGLILSYLGYGIYVCIKEKSRGKERWWILTWGFCYLAFILSRFRDYPDD